MSYFSGLCQDSKKIQKIFEKAIDKSVGMCYNMQVVKTRPVGQAVKTLASHAGNMGSIPVRVTKTKGHSNECPFCFGDLSRKRDSDGNRTFKLVRALLRRMGTKHCPAAFVSKAL